MDIKAVAAQVVENRELQTMIEYQIDNFTQMSPRKPNGLKKILEEFAEDCVELAIRHPVAAPNDHTSDWKRAFANAVEKEMLKNGLVEHYHECGHRIEKSYPKLVGHRAIDFEISYLRIADMAGQFATMVVHGLDPKVLLIE